MPVATHSQNYCYGTFTVEAGVGVRLKNSGTEVHAISATPTTLQFGSIASAQDMIFYGGNSRTVQFYANFYLVGTFKNPTPATRGLYMQNEAVPIRSYQQIAAAHGFFNLLGGTAGTPDPEGVYNVDSVTDHGPGDYSINFINAMASANYSFQVTPTADVFMGATPTRAVGSLRMQFVTTGGGSLTDPAKFSFAVFEGV